MVSRSTIDTSMPEGCWGYGTRIRNGIVRCAPGARRAAPTFRHSSPDRHVVDNQDYPSRGGRFSSHCVSWAFRGTLEASRDELRMELGVAAERTAVGGTTSGGAMQTPPGRPPIAPALRTRAEVAEYTRTGACTLSKVVARRELRVVRWGRAVRFRDFDLDAFIASRVQGQHISECSTPKPVATDRGRGVVLKEGRP